MKTKKVVLTAIVTALYAIAVIALAPISFLLFQVRVADALIPLSTIFGMPAVLGVTIGNIIANTYGGLGYIDVVGGSAANFIAAYLGWKVGSRRFTGSLFVATVVQNIVVSSIVGSYLAVLFGVPLEVGFFGVLLGSIISINMLGYMLILAILRTHLREFYLNTIH
ncbi:MAG: QueT transporter family protein [Candidatus Bathyarchaeia archaeon]